MPNASLLTTIDVWDNSIGSQKAGRKHRELKTPREASRPEIRPFQCAGEGSFRRAIPFSYGRLEATEENALKPLVCFLSGGSPNTIG
jgi:hypothetical protein